MYHVIKYLQLAALLLVVGGFVFACSFAAYTDYIKPENSAHVQQSK